MQSLTDQNLASILIEGSFLDAEVVNEALKLATDTKVPLENVLMDRELITDEHLGQIIAAEMGIPYVSLGLQAIDEKVFTLIPEAFAKENQLFLFKRTEAGFHVAMNHPEDYHLVQLVKKRLEGPLTVYYATKNDLTQAFHLYRRGLDAHIQELAQAALQTDTRKGEEDTQIVELVDELLEFAYASKASDLHLEPQENSTLVRFRIDGVLSDMLFLPKEVHEPIITRMKILSHLRTDEHFAAQDGSIRFMFGKEPVDIRLSILPTTFGEKVVLRLLSEKSRQFSLEELGMSDKDLATINANARKPWGMILVTGPTGSGKTTTLYAVLKKLNRREVNLSTIEDPVEYSISGINQIQVNTKTELTFAKGLRSIVRQDPDIIMVGEIRDEETAEISVNASLTGHLLLSTLHTNDAATALPRLLDMGIEPFLVASTVNVVVAQRLVRRVCKNCIESYETSAEEVEAGGLILPDAVKEKIFPNGMKQRLYRGKGCHVCSNSSYNGREGVFEVLVIDPKIRRMILEQQSSDVIRDYAVEQGMTTMFDDAVRKVLQGVTTLEEILRVVRE